MHVIIAYDISNNRTRNKMFKLLKEMGLNTQKSVFECELDRADLLSFQQKAETLLATGAADEEPADRGTSAKRSPDSVLMYPICRRCARGVTVLGQGIAVVHTDWTIL